MSTELARLADVPALIRRERAGLAELVEPEDVADAERRAAAIAELTKRAGLAIPVQNEATLYRAEALERLAVVVGEAQAAGEVRRAEDGRPAEVSDGRTLPELGLDRRRLNEGRALAETDVLDKVRHEVAQWPDRPLRIADVIGRATRVRREQALAGKRRELERGARLERARLEALGQRPFQLELGDVRSWRPRDPVHAIVTDPPYVTDDALELYSALADFALDVLEPGGVLAAMVFPPMLVDVVEALRRSELTFRWPIVWRFGTHPNTADQRRRVFDCTKLVLVYHRGAMPADAPMFQDLLESPGPEKDLHGWQQSLEGFERLVRCLSWPGNTVCDPFAGSGTTAVAALRSERLFVGCDVDAAALDAAARRLAA